MNLAGGNIVVSVFPDMPTPGALGAFTRPEKINEIQELEKSKISRLWEVRAFVSDHVPLAGVTLHIPFPRQSFYSSD